MKLRDFYYQTVNDNENGERWAGAYYGVLSKIINDNNYKKVAEIGIGYGTHAKYILKTTNIEHILLVDPTQYYPNDLFASDIMNKIPETTGNNFNELYDLIKEYLQDYENKYTWQRCPSISAVVDNNSLDCVFVDGEHTYSAVLNDLRFWHKKIRPGGKIVGDDYWLDSVKSAVHQFQKESGLKLTFHSKEGSDYLIYCFDVV